MHLFEQDKQKFCENWKKTGLVDFALVLILHDGNNIVNVDNSFYRTTILGSGDLKTGMSIEKLT